MVGRTDVVVALYRIRVVRGISRSLAECMAAADVLGRRLVYLDNSGVRLAPVLVPP